MVLNVKQKQIDGVVRVLTCNEGNTGTGKASKGSSEVYKVLVLDRFCRDLLAPLMRVNDLRKHGVTLHLMLETERQPIPDVTAVYLMQGTSANVESVTKDLQAGLYESYNINFCHSASREVMEELALGAVKSGHSSQIAQVFDQYVSFISLDSGLFSLGLPGSYVELNDPSAQDFHIEHGVSQIVDGLFSVLVTLGVVPIIRCPKGGLAQHVAQVLTSKLREHLSQRNNLFSETGPVGLAASMSRPLLILFDRNFEISTAVQHCWRYQPLVQDILGLHLNRVDVPSSGDAVPKGPGAPPVAKKSYDVGDGDFFWTENGTKEFPAVAEEVEIQLGKYKKAVDEINRRAEAGDDPTTDPDQEMEANTKHLMSAVATLPQLTERKRTLDKHTNIATALLAQIKSRNIDHFHQLEQDLLTGKVDFNIVMQTLQGSKGDLSDKLRLAIVYLLAAESVPGDTEMNGIIDALAAAGGSTKALSYVRRLRRMNLIGAGALSSGAASGTTASSQGSLIDWADKTFGQGLSAVTKGVKNLMSSTRQSMVALTVQALLEAKPGTEQEFEVMDPKLPPHASQAQLQERAKGPFRDSIVFMIGGGNYLECQGLRDVAATSPTPCNIVYGATELLSPMEFVQQLAELGTKS
mmetsp:Transcript_34832/g.98747  ORF Transcript_34832/g.98747 Transcript_34832/m.98747 type:complete len:637 (+) Transcript_34832:244-2154(+)|eukprot:CAMPEP_0117685064 /NCGR_PEP_ID=MMETSP0804-20121206/21515_1 /TAXON_ID=1074897 /ORGANISM="Tetraselmis astigmatica, Strain CCMP880" /LENGTH=636 /DNA_ID=CAMNT_0005496261 /DNA_START=164 /DNA_END=2074 /DNA_ORIENTATION=+